jgi:serine protease
VARRVGWLALLVVTAVLVPSVGGTPVDARTAEASGGAAATAPDGGVTWLVSVEDVQDATEVERRLVAAGLSPAWSTERVAVVTGERSTVERALAGSPAHVEPDDQVRSVADPAEAERFPEQWALLNDGSLPGSVAGVDVGALAAWQRSVGSPTVTIGVVDGWLYQAGPAGPVGGHPDLATARVTELAPPLPAPPATSDDPDACTAATANRASHAVQVATVAAADGAMVGLAPGVRVVSAPFLNDCGSGMFGDAILAIAAAGAAGADVIVTSWGGRQSSTALLRAIEDVGVPVIAAAGNNGRDISGELDGFYPASFQARNLLAVANLTSAGQLASTSNRSATTVDLAAPGQGVLAGLRGGGHGLVNGTSFAAPHVAAAVALARSIPSVLTSDAILDLVVATARPLPELEGAVVSGAMLDAAALVDAVAVGGACPVSVVPSGAFPDVAADSPHRLAIDCVAWSGVAQGRPDGSFGPEGTVTRGQMAGFLARLLERADRLPDESDDAFPDDDGSVHEPAIDALAALGIAVGDARGRFRPDDPVTRAQMASFTIRTVEVLRDAALPPAATGFDDTGGSVHATNIDQLRELGIAAGVAPRRFVPDRPLRRDQMASFVARTLDRGVRDGTITP